MVNCNNGKCVVNLLAKTSVGNLRNATYITKQFIVLVLTLLRPAFFGSLKPRGGGQICPHPLKMRGIGGRFKN